jgi:hypothetical protein
MSDIETAGANDAPQFNEVRIQLVGNGYIITASNGPGIGEEQFVARNIEDLTNVVRKIMRHPEGEA